MTARRRQVNIATISSFFGIVFLLNAIICFQTNSPTSAALGVVDCVLGLLMLGSAASAVRS